MSTIFSLLADMMYKSYKNPNNDEIQKEYYKRKTFWEIIF